MTQRGDVAPTERHHPPDCSASGPYRTFQEIEQPVGLFLIRIDERGITFTEADGGMWKLEARKTIKAYLERSVLAAEIEAWAASG
ncbi:MAG: hypothetical protein ACLR8L_00220 [Oscillospiraceae bacterium]